MHAEDDNPTPEIDARELARRARRLRIKRILVIAVLIVAAIELVLVVALTVQHRREDTRKAKAASRVATSRRANGRADTARTADPEVAKLSPAGVALLTKPAGTLVAAVADIACAPDDRNFNDGKGVPGACQHRAVAEEIASWKPAAVLLPGDLQYETGSLDDFRASFDTSFGALLGPLLRPAPGNHEYGTSDAAGYFDYFGTRAGPARRGWYSFDVGGWHVLSLNSNCRQAGGCDAGSPQYAWAQRDLAAHASPCAIAIWHHPRFSSGLHGSSTDTEQLWKLLDARGVDVVLQGHDHDYERFAPQSSMGVASPTGITSFVVGTGGAQRYFFTGIERNSEVRSRADFGALALDLRPGRFDWVYRTINGKVVDTGATACT